MLSPFTSIVKNFLGTKNAIIGGFIVEAICVVLIGGIAKLDDAKTFKWVAIAIRFVQGLGDMLMQVSCYSTVTYTFAENVIKYAAIVEISIGVGLAIGPAFGNVINSHLKFTKTLYVFAGLCLGAIIIDVILLPSFLNKRVSVEEKEEMKEEIESQKPKDDNRKVTWMTLLSNV